MKKIVLIIITISSQLMAQDLKQTALDHFNNSQWKAASKHYLKYLKENEGDSADWYNLAFSQAQSGEFDKAIRYFNEARKRNYNSAFIYFGKSKVYAQQNDSRNLIATLKESSENGFGAYVRLKSDPAFTKYIDSPELKEILEKIKLNAYPCLSNEDARHFDFWLGEWEVFAGGRKAGENSITMAKGGCAIHESYTTAGNYVGQSINFVDPADKKWRQVWVASGGGVLNYVETKRAEGLLQFEGTYSSPNGTTSLSRLTFTLNEDGTVRQFFENSADNGKTWTPSFDGLYKKKS